MKPRNIIHLSMIVSVALLLVSCGSTSAPPPCDPTVEIKEVPTPYPVVVVIEMLPPLELEPVPEMAPDDATPEEKKARALLIAETRERNHALLLARDEAWEMKVKAHNESAADVRPPEDP